MTSTSSPEFLTLQRALVGRFSLLRELGRGGMGVVFLARDIALDRNVAIKLLPPALALQPSYRQRFLREARLAASLSHPHIVPIHLVDEVDDLVFFVMGYIDGETLGEQVRRRGPLPVDDVVRVVQQVAWALAHAHSRGVVHRDVKPDNILIERDTGRAVVSDFGIAGGIDGGTPAEGSPVGTPLYLSPEQANGAGGDARSDLYALGVTAWYALTGTYPHAEGSVSALLVRKATQPAPPLLSARTDVPAYVAEGVQRCLAMLPADRWPDGESLAHHLEQGRGRGTVAPPRVRTFVRTAFPLGTEVATAGTAALASLGMMVILSRGGLLDALLAQALGIPIIGVSIAYAGIRIGQTGMALLDVVREGHDHATISRALEHEERMQSLEVDVRAVAQRRRDAIWYGSLGTAKSAAALWLASTHLPGWVTVPAAILSVVLPTFTALKVWQILRPGPGRWPRMLRGRFGARIMNLMRRFATPASSRAVENAPTVTLLGGAIEELFLQLPDDARRQLADIPLIARTLQREAGLHALHSDEASRGRAATIAVALDAIRLELLSLQAGLHDVPDVTRHLDEARRLSERVDQWMQAPETTPAS